MSDAVTIAQKMTRIDYTFVLSTPSYR